MSEVNRLMETIKKISQEMIDGNVPGGYTRAKLTQIEPELIFKITDKIEVRGQFIVTPKFKVFRQEDIGKDYVFFKDYGGQTYYYAYEPNPEQGKNGISYFWEGSIQCEINGIDSLGGACVVTEGYIHKIEHKKQVEDPGDGDTQVYLDL